MSELGRPDPEEKAAAPAAADRYDSTTITLHWLSAACVVVLWILGQTIDDFAKGLPRMSARSAHIVLGAVLLVIFVVRITWRARRGRRLPPADPGAVGRAAVLTHRLLYILVGATLVLGVANTWIRGDTLVGLFKIPSLAPGNDALRERVEDLHAWLANTVVIVAGLHAVAALFHHFVRRDTVLLRMLRPPR